MARRLGRWERRRVASRLEANQASHFRWALGKLGSPQEVRRALGIGEGVSLG